MCSDLFLAYFSARFLITLSSRRPEDTMEDISLQDSEDMDNQLYFEGWENVVLSLHPT